MPCCEKKIFLPVRRSWPNVTLECSVKHIISAPKINRFLVNYFQHENHKWNSCHFRHHMGLYNFLPKIFLGENIPLTMVCVGLLMCTLILWYYHSLLKITMKDNFMRFYYCGKSGKFKVYFWMKDGGGSYTEWVL